MVSRRRFIESSVAGSLTGAFAVWGSDAEAASSTLRGGEISGPAGVESRAWSRETNTSPRVPLYAVVFDERFADALRLGREAARLGLPTRGLPGDVTDFWYAELHPLWRRQARPIAGLTAYAALFCLERLAWDHGMRVVYHGEHTPFSSGEVEHVLYGSAGWLGPETLAAPGDGYHRVDWPVQIASLIAVKEARSTWSGLTPARRGAATRVRVMGAPPVRRVNDAREQRVGQPLHSWVIAPPARARALEEPV